MKNYWWIILSLIVLIIVGIILSQGFEFTSGCKNLCAGSCEKSFFRFTYSRDDRKVMGCHADVVEINS